MNHETVWTPWHRPDCFIWLDSHPQNIIFDGAGNVQTWLDKSIRRNYVTNAVAVNRPTYNPNDINFQNYPSLGFNGINQSLYSPILANIIPQPVSWYIVYKQSVLIPINRIISTSFLPGLNQIITNLGGGLVFPEINDNVLLTLNAIPPANINPHIINGIFDNGNSFISIDNALIGNIGNIGNATISQIFIASHQNIALYFNGEIACVGGFMNHDNLSMRTRMINWFSRFGTMY